MRRLVLMSAILALAAPGCGGEEDTVQNAAVNTKAKPKPKVEPAATIIDIEATPTGVGEPFRFSAKKLEAKAGIVEIRFVNADQEAHNIRIQTGKKCCDYEKDIGGTNTISENQKETARVKLAPGKYWFLCSINSHYDTDMGKMKGVLTVS